MQFLSTIVLLAATAAATAIPALRSDYSDYTVAQTGESHVSAVEGIVEKRQNARFALYACNARDFNDHEGCTRLWAGRDTCRMSTIQLLEASLASSSVDTDSS